MVKYRVASKFPDSNQPHRLLIFVLLCSVIIIQLGRHVAKVLPIYVPRDPTPISAAQDAMKRYNFQDGRIVGMTDAAIQTPVHLSPFMVAQISGKISLKYAPKNKKFM